MAGRRYEWRWRTDHLKSAKRHFAQPQWAGLDDITGRTVLLHAEQGFGDTLQFCRYAPRVAARGARVILEVQKPLVELMRTLSGDIEIIAKGDPLPAFDLHCPLMSLPLAFNTELDTIPGEIPYLSAAIQPKAMHGAHGSARAGDRESGWSGPATRASSCPTRISSTASAASPSTC